MSTGLIWLTPDARTHVLPAHWRTALAGHREGRWTWRLLDRHDQHLGDIDGVTGGQLEQNIHADVRGSGRLSWVGRLDDMPDWPRTRVQPVYTATLPDGTEVSWPWGIYLPAAPRIIHHRSHVEAEVDLWDKTLLLVRAGYEDDVTYPAGTNPLAAAYDQTHGALNPLGASGRDDYPAWEPVAGHTLRSSMMWDLEDDPYVKRVVDDLLDAAGYVATWADRHGRVTSGPYVPPSGRELSWAFEDGQASIYADGWTATHDQHLVPNMLTLISRGDADEEALRATALDIDPTSPYSYQSQGGWVTASTGDVEATSQAVLQGMADRALAAAQRRARTITIDHGPLPLWLADRASLTDAAHGINAASCVVQHMSITCDGTSLARSTLLEVST